MDRLKKAATAADTTDLMIGVLARRAGCRVETIRYYEREGLIPSPPRTSGGHRAYRPAHMKRLAFIRRARELGFTIEEVRSLLSLADSGDYTCADVRTRTLHHRGEIRRKLTDLKRLDRALSDLAAQCDGGQGRDCPIFEALFNAPAQGAGRTGRKGT